MADALAAVDEKKMETFMADEGITWHYSPPYDPHFNGAHESLVKSCKNAIRIVLGNDRVTDEVLMTVFKEVAAILNSRPLTHLSVDPDDPEPLTPNHFIHGRPLPSYAPGEFDPSDKISKKKWRAAQVYVDQNWSRWMSEWVPSLIERRKWLKGHENLKENDIVLVADPRTPRGQFPLGRVVKVMPGPDGIVRVAEVKTRTGIYTRGISKLCLIETSKIYKAE